MAFDGNGNYSVPAGTEGVPGEVIESAMFNAFVADLEAAFNTVMQRNGDSVVTADMDFGGFKLRNAADGILDDDVVTVGQMEAGIAAAVTEAVTEAKTLPSAGANLVSGEVYVATAGFTLNTGLTAGNIYPIYNNSAAAITITQGSGLTLRLAGTTTTGNRTLAARGMASVWCLSTTEYIISGAVL